VDINKLVEEAVLTTWENADDVVKEKMFEVVETSDYDDMVACNNLTCNNVITKDGSYTVEDLAELLVDEGVIDSEDDFESAIDDFEVTGIKFYNTVVHVNEVEDIEYNRETQEITKLGTTSTNYTLYCDERCAKSSLRSFYLMKQRYEENK